MNAVAQFLEETYELEPEAVLNVISYKHLTLKLTKKFIQALEEQLNLSKNQIKKLISIMPNLAFMNTDSLVEKFNKLIEVGVSADCICASPYLIGSPLEKIKFRKMLGNLCVNDFRIIVLSTDENRTYARLQYLRNETKFSKSNRTQMIYASDKGFEGIYGVDTKILLEKYPLTKEDVLKIQEENNAISELPLQLTETEMQAVLQKVDPAKYRKKRMQVANENE